MQPLQMMRRIMPPWLPEGVRYLAEGALMKQGRPRHVQRSLMQLDGEFARGRWDYLDQLQEMTRYAVIVGYCKYGRKVSSVLDLGCGAGVLRRHLDPLGAICDYEGVDLSTVAIEKASREWTDASTRFVARDVATYVPSHKFDVIVFNEILYYFEQPNELLTYFASFLEENGRFVISLWNSEDSRVAWQRARRSVDVIDDVEVRHGSGVSWRIRLCRPG